MCVLIIEPVETTSDYQHKARFNKLCVLIKSGSGNSLKNKIQINGF